MTANERRAAQFQPFAALKGFEKLLKEEENKHKNVNIKQKPQNK